MTSQHILSGYCKDNVFSSFPHIYKVQSFELILAMNNNVYWTRTSYLRTNFSCDQAALWMVQSVCLSLCPSHLSHHGIIMKNSGVITNDRRNFHAKGQGHRSKVKVTEVLTKLSSFGTVTHVWIHIWWWNDEQSLMLLRRGALLFFKIESDKTTSIYNVSTRVLSKK